MHVPVEKKKELLEKLDEFFARTDKVSTAIALEPQLYVDPIF